jgi:hypothetical protein
VHQLEVLVLGERRTVSTLSELAEVMASRIDGGNHFEIAWASSGFPALDVMSRDPCAGMRYFAHDGATETKRARTSSNRPTR